MPTLPSSSLRRAGGFALLALLLSCGDDGTSPPSADSIAAVGGTMLQGSTDTELAAPLQVRVVGTDGEPFEGQSVTWQVTAGGGSLSATATTTDADGIAEVLWTLGPAAGTNTATATAGTLGTVTFNATATFQTLEPQVDIPVEGDIEVERVVIPAGVTVTVTGPTTITATGEVDIAGTVVGDCVSLAIVGGSTGSVTGDVTNACTSSPDQVGPDLDFTVDGELEVTGGSFVSSGRLLIRNTPDITAEEILGSLDPPASPGPARQTQPADPCTFENAAIGPPPGTPPVAAAGEDGADGPDILLACSGDGTFTSGSVSGSPGGEGGPAVAGSSQLAAEAPGEAAAQPPDPAGQGERPGDGGNGGAVIYFFPGRDLEFNNYTINLHDGAPGSNHTATATAPGQSAIATASNGGHGGGMRITGASILIGPGGLTIVAGDGGPGGNGTATAMDGDPNQKGGDATSTAGNGGNTTEGRLNASAGVNGLGNITLVGGQAGPGGNASSTAGRGGDGTRPEKDGAPGGNLTATGGDGGSAMTATLEGATVGDGGDGGDVTLAGGRGGDGYDFCADPPIEIGGMGGSGGSVIAAAAMASRGAQGPLATNPGNGGEGGITPGDDDGEDGTITIADGTGNGGEGGDGAESAPDISGLGGDGGDPSGLPDGFEVPDEVSAFEDGPDGPVCNTPPMLEEQRAEETMKNTPVTVTLTYDDDEDDLPQVPGTVTGLDAGEGSIAGSSWMGNASSVSFVFQPAPDFVGTADFQVTVLDERGAMSNVSNVQVEVTNQVPVFNPDEEGQTRGPIEVQVIRGGSAMIDLPFTDGDGDAMDFMYVAGQGPDHGTVTPPTLPSGTSGPTVTYQHDGGDSDSDMFSVQAVDNSGGMTTGQVFIGIIDQPFSIEGPSMIDEQHTVGMTPCPQELAQYLYQNLSNEPGSFYAGTVNPRISFSIGGGSYTPESISSTIPAGESRMIYVAFNCASANDVDTVIDLWIGNGQGNFMRQIPTVVDVISFEEER